MSILSRLERSKRTYVMGILNVTPDSFSDGGRFLDKSKAVAHALKLISDGADIIDIGGESTRPGSTRVSADEELSRVIPVIQALRKAASTPISIDTMKSEVADEAVKAGAAIVNDVSALRFDEKMGGVVARHRAGLIITHMKGAPENMQNRPQYESTVKDIIADLRSSLKTARKAGISDDRIVIDPGIGFGKTLKHNLEILGQLEKFKQLKHPICIGASRKSFIGKALGVDDAEERLIGSITASIVAIMKGAKLIRAHDVRETVIAAKMADSVVGAGVF